MLLTQSARYVHYLQYTYVPHQITNNFTNRSTEFKLKSFPASDGARACWLLVANDVERALGELEDKRVDGRGRRNIMGVTAGSIRERCRAEFKKGKKTSRLKYIR